MRKAYMKQLDELHDALTRMGALCEEAIACAAKVLLEGDGELRRKTLELEQEIDLMERDIEGRCVRLLLHQQPMASDLRRVTAAQRMIVDMERIGDQAADIAEVSRHMTDSPVQSDVHIAEMARATVEMVTDSIEAFVKQDLEAAKRVIAFDDTVDGLFRTIRNELIEQLKRGTDYAEDCVDLLMIAKYFERIGDHAELIATWVVYFLTGSR